MYVHRAAPIDIFVIYFFFNFDQRVVQKGILYFWVKHIQIVKLEFLFGGNHNEIVRILKS